MDIQTNATAPSAHTSAASILPPATSKGQVVTPTAAAPAKKSKSSTSKKAATPAKEPGKAAPKSKAKAMVKPAKATAQPTAKTPAHATAKSMTASATRAVKAKEPKESRRKSKVVRDSFTMPEADYAKLAALKARCLKAGISVKKSELLRAGLQLLETLPAKKLQLTLATLENIKTGRPTKD